MAITKEYRARNGELKERILKGVGLLSGILIVGFLLLFGSLDMGKDVSVTIVQPLPAQGSR
jgi:hypothetical protein